MRWSPCSFLCIVILLTSTHVFSQSPVSGPDYREVFGEDYGWALKIVESNSWWSDTLSEDGFDPKFTLAIIFPELVRYSGIADYIEVKGLEVLYVQYGRDYADFSVGLFQMKPSFAERIESDIRKYGLLEKFSYFSALNPMTPDDISSRKERIIRLKDGYFQLLYLEAFVRIMDFLYPEQAKGLQEEKLVFYSTAYNTGYFKDESVIMHEIKLKRFYRGMDPSSVKYSYSDLSLAYYISVKQ